MLLNTKNSHNKITSPKLDLLGQPLPHLFSVLKLLRPFLHIALSNVFDNDGTLSPHKLAGLRICNMLEAIALVSIHVDGWRHETHSVIIKKYSQGLSDKLLSTISNSNTFYISTYKDHNHFLFMLYVLNRRIFLMKTKWKQRRKIFCSWYQPYFHGYYI